jgi:predicted AAA+ superfamily ATPase
MRLCIIEGFILSLHCKNKTAKIYIFEMFCGFMKPQKLLMIKSFTIMIIRTPYIDRLKKMLGIKVIKVVTGLRRVGKSTLFKQFQQELLNSGVAERQIIYLNFEEMESEALLERHVLHDYIMRMADKSTINYVFLDEIQMVSEFEKLIDSLFVKNFLDIYITGSNAWFLSSELATMLTGRYIEIPVLPLSFKEFSSIFTKSKAEIFEDYINFGGMPEVSNIIQLNNLQEITPYLNNVYQTILEKDIYKRNKIKSKFDFENIVRFTLDSVGGIVSPNKIAETVTANGNSIDNETVENYLKVLEDAFMINKVNRYDVRGKKMLQTLNKYYFADTGLQLALLGRNAQINRGHLLENLVYIELKRRYKEIYIGKVLNTECDFVCKDDKGLVAYYQVSLTLREEKTLARELAPFNKINNHFPKYLLTLDPEEPTYDGVQQINAINWLLGN